jgi:hypothetical protein
MFGGIPAVPRQNLREVKVVVAHQAASKTKPKTKPQNNPNHARRD